MPLGEFELIDRYFRPLQGEGAARRADVIVGIGDDAAVLAVPAGQQLVAALDTLVEGVHFPVGSPAHSVGHRALAVNLSDLAAMGSEPAWYLLSLTLPEVREAWLAELARGLGDLAAQAGVALVGGDTTRGPLSLSVQALGLVRPGEALLRSGARPGDLLFVSGTVGDAAAGLALEMAAAESGAAADDGDSRQLRRRFLYPTPRIGLGRALRAVASACIDVSDGLAADALKLATASGCGVRIEVERLPLSPSLLSACGTQLARRHAMAGGDDYELCFTVPAGRLAELADRVAASDCPVTCIGALEPQPGLRVLQQGVEMTLTRPGFDHFATS